MAGRQAGRTLNYIKWLDTAMQCHSQKSSLFLPEQYLAISLPQNKISRQKRCKRALQEKNMKLKTHRRATNGSASHSWGQ